jgi:hypothetical protein
MNHRVSVSASFHVTVAAPARKTSRPLDDAGNFVFKRLRGELNNGFKSMATRFFRQFLQKFCRHEFSWPHSGVHGQDYQVCVRCGAIYEYDWGTMRRTRRLGSPLESQAEFKGEAGQRN